MASRIKGITVEIGGDTTKLEQSLKSVNTTIKSTQSELKDVSKLLKLDPSNTELLSQKQKALKDAIGATKEKLDTLKTAQEQAKKQLEEGTLGQDKYDALQREIVETDKPWADNGSTDQYSCQLFPGWGRHTLCHSISKMLIVGEGPGDAPSALRRLSTRDGSKPMSIEYVMPSNHLILCRPLLPSIFPNIRVFANDSSSHQVAKVLEF